MGINIFPTGYPLFPFPLCLYYYYTYGCARLTLPSQWLVKSFIANGAKIVFCNFGNSESTPNFGVFFHLCESQDLFCYLVLQYLMLIAIARWLYIPVQCLLATELGIISPCARQGSKAKQAPLWPSDIG